MRKLHLRLFFILAVVLLFLFYLALPVMELALQDKWSSVPDLLSKRIPGPKYINLDCMQPLDTSRSLVRAAQSMIVMLGIALSALLSQRAAEYARRQITHALFVHQGISVRALALGGHSPP